jgi:hypothetical protein
MIFKLTAIIHQNTSTLQITEEIEAKDKEETLLLFKARHAENLVKILDTTPSPPHNETPIQFVTQG